MPDFTIELHIKWKSDKLIGKFWNSVPQSSPPSTQALCTYIYAYLEFQEMCDCTSIRFHIAQQKKIMSFDQFCCSTQSHYT